MHVCTYRSVGMSAWAIGHAIVCVTREYMWHVYICIYHIHIHTYIHRNTLYAQIHTHILTQTLMHVDTYMQTSHSHTCARILLHTLTYMDAFTYKYTHTRIAHTHMYPYVVMHMCAYSCKWAMRACMHACAQMHY